MPQGITDQMPVMIDLISENDQSKFHSHQAISAPSRGSTETV